MPPKTKLFVGTLPPDCQEVTLRKLFENHGEVVECSVMGSYAFVHMKTEDEAISAIENLHNYDVDGYKICVEQSTGEKRGGDGPRGGRGRGRGNFRGRGRGFGGGRGGGPMRGGRDPYGPPRDGFSSFRSSPYDRPMGYDRRPPPPQYDRYGPVPPHHRNGGGYYDEYERPAPPMERRPPPPPQYSRDPYGPPRYDDYDRRMPPLPGSRRSPDRRPLPPAAGAGYDRRDPYEPRPREPYYQSAPADREMMYSGRGAAPSSAARAPSPPRYQSQTLRHY